MAADTTTTVQEKPRETTAEERISFACPGCGTALEKVIPAGTALGIASLMRKMNFSCESCAGKDDEAAMQRERTMLRRRHELSCLLPPELRGLSFADYDTERRGATAALAAAQAWSKGEHEKRGLIFTGDVGVGKTRLAATALWAALDSYVDPRRARHRRGDEDPLVPGIAVTYVNVAELVVKLQASFGDSDRREALSVLTGKGALVLDDIDKINPTMTVLSHLYAAIDGRVQAGAALIVTTNLTPSELLEKLSRANRDDDAEARKVAAKSIISRLLGYCTVHGIQGPDGRMS